MLHWFDKIILYFVGAECIDLTSCLSFYSFPNLNCNEPSYRQFYLEINSAGLELLLLCSVIELFCDIWLFPHLFDVQWCSVIFRRECSFYFKLCCFCCWEKDMNKLIVSVCPLLRIMSLLLNNARVCFRFENHHLCFILIVLFFCFCAINPVK